MWDNSLHLYKKCKTFTKKYNVLFCPHYSLWIIPTSGMGLGWIQPLNFWYGLGPSLISQLLVWAWAELNLLTSGMGLDRAQSTSFKKGMGYPFCGPISYFNFPTFYCPSNLYSLLKREIWPKQWRNTYHHSRLRTKRSWEQYGRSFY